MNTIRSQKLSESIQKTINEKKLLTLPSIYVLSRRYRVSRNEIIKAIRILRDKGVIDVSRGRKATVVQPGRQAGDRSDIAVEKFTLFIRNKIENGIYRTGQALPKFVFYTTTEHVSPNTICAAFEKLRHEDLIHKEGKKWVVGPKQTSVQVSRKKTPACGFGTVLILMRDLKSWQNDTHFSEFALPFIREVLKELERYGIRSRFVQHSELNYSDIFFPTGKDEILACIQSPGTHYTGALVMGNTRVFPEIADYALWLERFGKPVVWFDSDTAVRHAPETSRPGSYYYFVPDLSRLVECAIDELFSKGHRRVLFPVPGGIEHLPWIQERVQCIESAVEKRGDGMSVTTVVLNDEIWKNQKPTDMDDINSAQLVPQPVAAETGCARDFSKQAVREKMRAQSTSLGQAIAAHHATALIAPNQYTAISLSCRLMHSGFSIPRDISLVTFDNRFCFSCFPLSTVDWKFDDIGYRAAHILSGIMPVHIGKGRIFYNEPALIDRGSVGPPPRSVDN